MSSIKKYRQMASLIIKVNNVKMANLVIEEILVLDHVLHECIRYNPTYKIK